MRKYIVHEKFLGLSGIGLILSIFTINTKILTIALTVFILAVIMNVNKTFGKDVLTKAERIINENAENYLKEKKYGSVVINYISFPMMIIGIICVGLHLIVMWMNIL